MSKKKILALVAATTLALSPVFMNAVFADDSGTGGTTPATGGEESPTETPEENPSENPETNPDENPETNPEENPEEPGVEGEGTGGENIEPEAETAPTLNSTTFKYANSDIEITNIVDKRYHNAENPLSLQLAGQDFEAETEYTINVDVKRTAYNHQVEDYYQTTITKTGAELNENATAVLEGLTLELMDESHLALDESMYQVTISSDAFETISFGIDYGYENVNHLADANLLVDIGGEVENPVVFKSTPSPVQIATAADNATAYFYVTNLPADETFSYILKKARISETSYIPADTVTVLEGELTGADISRGEINTPVDYDYNYYLLIKTTDGIVSWNSYSFQQIDSASLTKVGVASTRGALAATISGDGTYYTAKTGNPINFTLYGKNFNENETYNVTMSIQTNFGGNGFSETVSNIVEDVTRSFTGAELNAGAAVIALPYSETLGESIANPNVPEGKSLLYNYGTAIFSVEGSETVGNVNFKYVNKSFATSLHAETEDNAFTDEITLYLNINDFQNLDEDFNWIAGLVGQVEYDHEKLELVSAEALNGYDLTAGDNYVLSYNNNDQVAAGTDILKLTFNAKDTLAHGESTTVKFAHIVGSDGENNIAALDAEMEVVRKSGEAEILSSNYNVNETSITGVPTNLTATEFVSGFTVSDGAHIVLLDKDNAVLPEDATIGTGAKVELKNIYDETVATYTVIIKGDVNGDGQITLTDLVKVKRYLANLDELDENYLAAGDVTSTGDITITDVVRIGRHIAGLGEIAQ